MPDPNMQPPPQPPPKQNPFKQLFAGTLTAVLQASGAGLAAGLTTVMTGAIQNWFNKPPKGAASMPGDPSAGMGGMPGMPGAAMPTLPTGMPDAMGGMQPSPGMPTGMPDSMGGMPASGMPSGDMTAAAQAPMGMPATSMPPSLYAGLAYEVQTIARSGETLTVDPATHYFATGDRFVVLYRPSLPGQVAIYNVNPLGQEKKIDAVNVAAGELTRLGPYEFRHNAGTEVMRLILSPCLNDGLMATTRDIVKVDEMQPVGATSAPASALNLPSCSMVAAQNERPQTRDIVKVGAEEGTMFALDPVAQQEVQTGNYTARELTLTFNHR
ncbi:MAG: hypothetical protein M3O07_09825 [Pseudomonadota bacterium]|nr:hypothetical protein [Pseudomonadota bacterium]